MVGLTTNALEDSKRANPAGRKLPSPKSEVLGRELDPVSHLKLLGNVISVIIAGHTFLSLD